MVIQTILYALGIYFIAKSMAVLIFKKPLMSWAIKIAKKKKSVNWIILFEAIFGIIILLLGYFFF